MTITPDTTFRLVYFMPTDYDTIEIMFLRMATNVVAVVQV